MVNNVKYKRATLFKSESVSEVQFSSVNNIHFNRGRLFMLACGDRGAIRWHTHRADKKAKLRKY